MIKAIIFDLDGTLIQMDEDAFKKLYFGLIGKKLAEYGQDPELVIKGVKMGVMAMIKNGGTRTNCDAFWGEVYRLCPNAPQNIIEIFDQFYRNEFLQTAVTCNAINGVNDALASCKAKGLKIILGTNPMFPTIGMQQRLKFGNIDTKYFDHITNYNDYHFAKPNPNFLKELLAKNNLRPEEVIYFGNSQKEDIEPAQQLGLKCYLVGTSNEEHTMTQYKITDVPQILDKELKK